MIMKNIILYGITVVLCLGSCRNLPKNKIVENLPIEQTSVFTSSDKDLEHAYIWARKMALSYIHDGSDSVGYWYEAALPQREAFCMRDVSHQSVGAQILGLSAYNKNMFTKFVQNITEEKDWCSYWEINRNNQPAPVDYANDKEFWYNLNANFDLIQACFKMYEWTGDLDYLTDSCFTNFYDKSRVEYIQCWQLEPENIMLRPRYMNQPENFDINNSFHTCRGLASYVENFEGLTVGVDLIATLYAGFKAHSQMATLMGNTNIAQKDLQMALAYQRILEEEWWSEDSSYYQTFWTEDRTFHRGEGVPFILWFNATDNVYRIQSSIKDILRRKWNIENLSAFPTLLYRFGYDDEAYHFLTSLPQMDRSEYPEVSYGIIEGTISGLMGIMPSASQNTISTCSHLKEGEEAKVENVPIFDGYITVRHIGKKFTEIVNNTGRDFTWKVSLGGGLSNVNINGKNYPANLSKDSKGNIISTVSINLPIGHTMTAKASVTSF